MGNILCVPRLPKEGRGKKKKRRRKCRWFFRKANKIGLEASASSENCREEESFQQENGSEKDDGCLKADEVSLTRFCHVDPVVSSSILLKHCDDEPDFDTETTTHRDGRSGDVKVKDSSAEDLDSHDEKQSEEVAASKDTSKTTSVDSACGKIEGLSKEDRREYIKSSSENDIEPDAKEAITHDRLSRDVNTVIVQQDKVSMANDVSERIKENGNALTEISDTPPSFKFEGNAKGGNDAKCTELFGQQKVCLNAIASTEKAKQPTPDLDLQSEASIKKSGIPTNAVAVVRVYEKESRLGPEYSTPRIITVKPTQLNEANSDIIFDTDTSGKGVNVVLALKNKAEDGNIIINIASSCKNMQSSSETKEKIEADEDKQGELTKMLVTYDHRGEAQSLHEAKSVERVDTKPQTVAVIEPKNDSSAANNLVAASSSPFVPSRSVASDGMKELAKVLEALSALKVPIQIDALKTTRSRAGFSRNVDSPHPSTSKSTQPKAVTRTEVQSENATTYSAKANNTAQGEMLRDMSTKLPHPGNSGSLPVDADLPTSPIPNTTTSIKQNISSKEVRTKPSTSSNLTLSPSENTDSSGYYKSSDAIQKWLKNSASEPLPVTKPDSDKDISRKVSDFVIPKKKPRPPPTPLVLKKPSPHLFGLPGIAKSDLTKDGDIRWTQRDPTSPQTDVLWSSKPTYYDVKLPPLPKRLLQRKGSIYNLRDSWVLPQVKQIETLKREYGRFPGLRVPKNQRNKYSVDIDDTKSSAIDTDEGNNEKPG